ncbi:MAG: hypothetical protein AB1578_12200 [Thermodesulfobacteriota bacterium]|jgi:hypothetical protein
MTACQRCGAELRPGSLKYLLTIHVTADFDGAVPAEGGIEDLEAFMRQVDARDTAELEKDVYQSQGYLLCPRCKAAFLRDPLGLQATGKERGEGGSVH